MRKLFKGRSTQPAQWSRSKPWINGPNRCEIWSHALRKNPNETPLPYIIRHKGILSWDSSPQIKVMLVKSPQRYQPSNLWDLRSLLSRSLVTEMWWLRGRASRGRTNLAISVNNSTLGLWSLMGDTWISLELGEDHIREALALKVNLTFGPQSKFDLRPSKWIQPSTLEVNLAFVPQSEFALQPLEWIRPSALRMNSNFGLRPLD